MNHPNHSKQTSPRRILVLCFALIALAASACSSGQGPVLTTPAVASGEAASATVAMPAAASTIYVSTATGGLLAVDPANESSGVLWTPSDTQLPVLEVAPTANGAGLHVLLNDADYGIQTSLFEITDSALAASSSELSSQALCLDNHANATTPLAHELRAAQDNTGSRFAGVSVSAPTAALPALVTAERTSLVCPRWTSQRGTVLTSVVVPGAENVTAHLVIEDATERFDIGTDGCVLDASSVSPNDSLATINVSCSEDRSDESGLYLLKLDEVGTSTTFADLDKIADGRFGRSAWDPSGALIAATRSGAAAEDQSVLVIIDAATGASNDMVLPDGASPHSITWLASAVH